MPIFKAPSLCYFITTAQANSYSLQPIKVDTQGCRYPDFQLLQGLQQGLPGLAVGAVVPQHHRLQKTFLGDAPWPGGPRASRDWVWRPKCADPGIHCPTCSECLEPSLPLVPWPSTLPQALPCPQMWLIPIHPSDPIHPFSIRLQGHPSLFPLALLWVAHLPGHIMQ